MNPSNQLSAIRGQLDGVVDNLIAQGNATGLEGWQQAMCDRIFTSKQKTFPPM